MVWATLLAVTGLARQVAIEYMLSMNRCGGRVPILAQIIPVPATTESWNASVSTT